MIFGRLRQASLAARLLMFVLGIVATPSIGLASMRRPHCAQHEQTPSHDSQGIRSGGMADRPTGPIWTHRHYHECPHCPASECARTSPCTGTGTAAVRSATTVVTSLDGHRVARKVERERAHSALSPPGTPPPQPIA